MLSKKERKRSVWFDSDFLDGFRVVLVLEVDGCPVASRSGAEIANKKMRSVVASFMNYRELFYFFACEKLLQYVFCCLFVEAAAFSRQGQIHRIVKIYRYAIGISRTQSIYHIFSRWIIPEWQQTSQAKEYVNDFFHLELVKPCLNIIWPVSDRFKQGRNVKMGVILP